MAIPPAGSDAYLLELAAVVAELAAMPRHDSDHKRLWRPRCAPLASCCCRPGLRTTARSWPRWGCRPWAPAKGAFLSFVTAAKEAGRDACLLELAEPAAP